MAHENHVMLSPSMPLTSQPQNQQSQLAQSTQLQATNPLQAGLPRPIVESAIEAIPADGCNPLLRSQQVSKEMTDVMSQITSISAFIKKEELTSPCQDQQVQVQNQLPDKCSLKDNLTGMPIHDGIYLAYMRLASYENEVQFK